MRRQFFQFRWLSRLNNSKILKIPSNPFELSEEPTGGVLWKKVFTGKHLCQSLFFNKVDRVFLNIPSPRIFVIATAWCHAIKNSHLTVKKGTQIHEFTEQKTCRFKFITSLIVVFFVVTGRHIMRLLVNSFVSGAPFFYPLKTSESCKVSWCLQGVGKGCIWSKWVNHQFKFPFNYARNLIFTLVFWTRTCFLGGMTLSYPCFISDCKYL